MPIVQGPEDDNLAPRTCGDDSRLSFLSYAFFVATSCRLLDKLLHQINKHYIFN